MNNSTENTPLILLAAGKSSRMGQPKGLLKINGKSWISQQVETFASYSESEVIVVAGAEFAEYESELKDFDQVSLIENTQVDLGPFSSIQLAASHVLSTNPSYVFLKPILSSI